MGLVAVVGVLLTLYGVYLVYPPAAVIAAGVGLATWAFSYDYQPRSERETVRRTPRP